MSDTVTEKYIYDCPKDNSALWAALMNKDNSAETAAMMNNMGNWNNNPFIWLIWMMFFRNGWNNNGGDNGVDYNSRAIASLQDTVNTNHNNDLVLQGINGSASAINELASAFGTNSAVMQGAISEVRNAIDRVAATSGITGERVINSVLMGNKDLTSALQSCCCENRLLTTQLNYQTQLGQKDIQYDLATNINGLNNTLQQNFSSANYERAAQTCSINNNMLLQTQSLKDDNNRNTAIIVSKLTEMQTQALNDKIAELIEEKTNLKTQISQEQQNQVIAGMIAPLQAQINAIRAAQPATTVVQYPQLEVVPTYLLNGYLNRYNTTPTSTTNG